MSTAVALRKEFGADLRLGPKLTEWGWSERRRVEELEKLRAGQDADLPRVRERAPTLWAALQGRPFQITGAAFAVKAKHFILGDEMRLGKTYQALAAMVESGAGRVLIACPRTATRSVWMRKINELCPKYMPFVAQGSRTQRLQVIKAFNETPYPQKVLIINKEMIREVRRWSCEPKDYKGDGKHHPDWAAATSSWCDDHKRWENRVRPGKKNGCGRSHDHSTRYHPEYKDLFVKTWDMIILDECHHALASEKNVQSDGITQIRLGAVHLPLAKEGFKLGLSGTPFRSKLTKSWGVLNWCRPDVFSSFWRYVEELFYVSSNGWGGARVIGELRSEEALQDVLRPYYLARTKSDVAPWLPPVEYVEVLLPMEGKQAQAYSDMKEDARAHLDEGNLDATGVLAELMRLKQFACSYGRLVGRDFMPALPSNKFDWVLQFLEEMWDVPERKVVIASQFTKLVKLYAEELRKAGYPCITLTGESTDKQREHAQDEFLVGKTRVIIINLFAGGEAIDLSSADDIVFIDEPWTDDARQQAENRVQNLAKKQQVTVHYIRSESSIDQDIADMDDQQRAQLKAAKPTIVKGLMS
jgi:SNF2 family DNA or RNA helicase